MQKAVNRLLVVDDEPDIAALIGGVASRCGYAVEAVGEREGFLARIDFPTHIVLDLNMPAADGIECLRLLAERRSRAKIIIASGVDSRVVEAARQLGQERGLDVVATLLKPFRTEELRSLLTSLLLEDQNLTTERLEQAIADGELALVYQPKVDLRTGEISGYEGLVRWQHPRLGTIAPDRFIPLAEGSGLIDLLTDAVIGIGVRELSTWRNRPDVRLSLNMSGRNLLDLSFADRIAEACAEQDVRPDRLVLELTETSAMTSPADAMDILSRLRLKGFRLAIDDFGTGYSSMLQLARLPFSELKVDRRFVKEVEHSRECRAIVKSMIDLAHNLDLEATAEGIETPEIMNVLRELGCDQAQGYLFAKPMAPDQIGDWLAFWARRRADIFIGPAAKEAAPPAQPATKRAGRASAG